MMRAMNRPCRWLPRLALLAGCLVAAAPPAAAEPAPKVLRIASASETGFDPARVGDVPSFLIISHIFEPLLGYDPLARQWRFHQKQ